MIVMADGTEIRRLEQAQDGRWMALISKSIPWPTEHHMLRQYWIHEFAEVEHPVDGPFNDLESAYRTFKKHVLH